MRVHLNTLYITKEHTWVHLEGENIVVKLNGTECARFPLHLLGGVVCFGTVGATPALLGKCAALGIGFTFLTNYGRFWARVEGPSSGNVLLRRSQYRTSDEVSSCVEISRYFVVGKILNQRTVIRRSIRDHRSSMGDGCVDRLESCVNWLTESARRANACADVNTLRGLEGDAAKVYFSVFDCLILQNRDTFKFRKRSRRPPLDPINALLSFLYTLLVHDCRSALESVGLESSVGFLHRDRPGRPSLALDLMEELRPILADRITLSLINRKQLNEKYFSKAISGAITLTEKGRMIVLATYQDRKKREITHPHLKEKMSLGLVPFVQASLLARLLRNDIELYPPFVWQ